VEEGDKLMKKNRKSAYCESIRESELENLYCSFGSKVRKSRKSLHMTQGEAAHIIGISRPSLANIEAGRQRVNLDTALLISKALGVSVGGLIGENVDETRLRGRVIYLERRLRFIRNLLDKMFQLKV
jgi:DNA-binding XRE family transcriptional regulator